MAHTCHATACDIRVPESMFMHRGHWYMLTAKLRAAVWAAYVPGQEIRKNPSEAYLKAAREAIDYIEMKEKTGKYAEKGKKK